MTTKKASNWLDRKREKVRQYQARQRKAAREVGDIPSPEKPRRRKATQYNYEKFCKTYFPSAFTLPWSSNHRKAAQRIETAVLDGGLFAFALPRGMGKTTMCEWACMWALCHAHHGFVLLVGATGNKAKERLKSIQVEFTTNPLLLADFPEIMAPIHALGTAKKQAEYQTHNGIPTCVDWTTELLVLPTIWDSKTNAPFPSSGSTIQVAGITGGEIRGLNHKRQDGSIIRPTLAIADDPQTRESAKSPTQSETRTQTLAADVAYCAGPGQPISVIVPCTVIYQGDLAERITDREQHPEYQGIRTKMVESFPENQALWDKYREIWRDSLINDGDMKPATQFYRKHRKAMDVGAEVSWPQRFGPHEISGIQHAMNLLIRDEAAFWSEMQNEPLENAGAEGIMCNQAEILAKTNDYQRFVCPRDSVTVTAFIDVQPKNLYYVLCSWQDGFSGQVLDYGVWPDQGRRRVFSSTDLINTFDKVMPHLELEAQLYAGLKALVAELCGHAYPIDGGGEARVERVLIDANWGQQTNTVYQFCRECRFGTHVHPSHGKYVGATSQPWSQWARKRGEKVGPHWRLRPSQEWPIKHVIYDTNYYKTFVHARLRTEPGAAGCLSIYGRGTNNHILGQSYHVAFADQLCAEIPIRTESKERVAYEWKLRANRPDNHFLDCLVGASVAASMCGIELEGSKAPRRRSAMPAMNFRDSYMAKYNAIQTKV